MLFRRSTARNSEHPELFPWPSLYACLAGAAATWQQRKLRGEELPGCPGRRIGAWSNPCLGQPAHPVVK
eukprot:1095268-Pelagomonas_calceolata.AAC.5